MKSVAERKKGGKQVLGVLGAVHGRRPVQPHGMMNGCLEPCGPGGQAVCGGRRQEGGDEVGMQVHTVLGGAGQLYESSQSAHGKPAEQPALSRSDA